MLSRFRCSLCWCVACLSLFPAQSRAQENDPRAYQGYSLLAPMNSTETYLIDMDGKVVNRWKSDYRPALSSYLLAKLRSLGYVGGSTHRPGSASTNDKKNGPQSAPPGARPGRGHGPSGSRGGERPEPDWMHANCVSYNVDLDQIMLSLHSFNEIWVIDHGTTTQEAAAHSGGRRG